MSNYTTTLSEFHNQGADPQSLSKLMSHLGKSEIDDMPISLLAILDSNGFRDALWALSAIQSFKQIERQIMALWAEEYAEDLGGHISTLRQEGAEQGQVDEAIQAIKLFIWREVWSKAWDFDWDHDWATSLGSEWPEMVVRQEQQLRDVLTGSLDNE